LEESLEQSAEVVAKAQPLKSIDLHLELDGAARVLADDLLDEAFTNILSNAVSYTEGRVVPIEIRVQKIALQDSEVRESLNPKRYWSITFTDHGQGIRDELKGKVFTRYLENARGSGLGLSIVYALIVDRYSGKIMIRNRVEGDYQKGTVIEVWIPQSH
jgi:signal transduction histidine kinase